MILRAVRVSYCSNNFCLKVRGVTKQTENMLMVQYLVDNVMKMLTLLFSL